MLSDYVALNNVLPSVGGWSLGEQATAGLQDATQPPATASGKTPGQGGLLEGQSPLATFLVVLGFLLLLMWLAHTYGEPGEYSNLKASAYNVLFIGLTAALFIPLLKVAAVKIPGPWTSYFLSI
uniref:Uncharacterized protein n=1 Tax=Thermus caliditerrae TaxID=1330700 RepID=A0A7C5VFB2_9DEIN